MRVKDLMITTEEELLEVASRVNKDLQDIQNYLEQKPNELGKVRIPYGFIRTAAHFRSQLGFIGDKTLKDNISYALILSDVFRWILNRTSIKGTAKEMVIKEGVCLFGSLVESITKDFLKGKISAKAGYKDRTDFLFVQGFIPKMLQEELDWLWDMRNNEHVFLLKVREHQHYYMKDYNRAIRAVVELRDSLQTK